MEETPYAGWRRQLSLALLVVANLLPLYFVFAFDWDVTSLIVLYWSENLIIGFYTLLKMLVTSPIGGFFSGLFFLVHYGGFCAVHGLFILTLLLNPEAKFLEGDNWPFILVFVELLVDVSRQVLAEAPPAWVIAFGGLMVSHGMSFLVNFLIGGERHRSDIRALMGAPYGRIIIMHFTVLLGGFGAMMLGQPLAMVVILVLLKLSADIYFHIREHRKAGETALPA